MSARTGEISDAAPGPRKAAARREILAERGLLGPQRRGDLNAALLAHLAALLRGMDRPPASVAAYYPVGAEPGGRMLVDVLQGEAEQILLPVTEAGGRLSWAVYRGHGQLALWALGTREPTGERSGTAALLDCAAVIVPALAVDPDGVRLGRGGGFYDRTLDELDRLAAQRGCSRPPAVALVYGAEDGAGIPTAAHDAAVDVVVSDRGTRRIG